MVVASTAHRPAAYGFIGTGEITAAVVTGLSTGPADPPLILLSPRGADVARDLARRFPNVRVGDSNQAVVDDSTSIVLAVRTPLVRDVLPGLTFRPEQVVLSAVAGVGRNRLRELAEPAGHIVRVIPLPQADRRQSLTAMFPDSTVGRELFSRLGRVVVPNDEEAFEAFSAATATFAAHLDYVTTISDWLIDR